MKNNITKIIASVAFGLIISSTAMASEEDYGDDIYTPTSHAHIMLSDNKTEDYGDMRFVINSNDTHDMFNDNVSVIDMNYSSND